MDALNFLSALPAPEAKSASYQNRMVLLLTLVGGVAALDAQAVFYLMPFIARDLALRDFQIGVIGSSVLVGWAVSGVIVSRLSDIVGRRKPFLIGSLVAFALLSGASALARGFVALIVARIAMGLAEGPVIPVKQAIVMAQSSPARRAVNMGIVQNFGSQLIGTLVAPILLVWIATAVGWRSAFLIASVPALILAWFVHRLIDEPPPSAGRARLSAAARSGDCCQIAIYAGAVSPARCRSLGSLSH
jgi:ACS family hexuronate transporter-like MFS transporter